MDNHETTLDALRSFKRTVTSVRNALVSLSDNQLGQARQTSMDADDVNGQVFKIGAYESSVAYRQAAGMLFPLEELAAGEVQRRAGYDQASAADEEADELDRMDESETEGFLSQLRDVTVDRGAVRYRTPSERPIRVKESAWASGGKPFMMSIAPGRVLVFTAVTEGTGDIRVCLMDDDHLTAVAEAFREEEWANGARLAFSSLGGLLRTTNDPAEIIGKVRQLTERARELDPGSPQAVPQPHSLSAMFVSLRAVLSRPIDATPEQILADVQTLVTAERSMRQEFDQLVLSLAATMPPYTAATDEALVMASRMREKELEDLKIKVERYERATKAAGLTLAEPLPGDHRLIPDGSKKDY